MIDEAVDGKGGVGVVGKQGEKLDFLFRLLTLAPVWKQREG